jgi:hypothetical protein
LPRKAQIPSLLLALTALLLTSSLSLGQSGGGGAGASTKPTPTPGIPSIGSPATTGPAAAGITSPSGTATPLATGSDTAGFRVPNETDAKPGLGAENNPSPRNLTPGDPALRPGNAAAQGLQEGRSANGDAKPGLFHEHHVPSGDYTPSQTGGGR